MSRISILSPSLDDHDGNHSMLPICDDIPDDQSYVTRITKSKKAYTYYRRRRKPTGRKFPIRKSPRLSPRFSPRRSPRLSSQ